MARRPRLTKVQLETQKKKAAFVEVLKGFSHPISEIAFIFSEAKEEAQVANAALVALAEKINGIGVE